MSFSDIYHSDEEYFRKLKDLKAAHVETMAKLEKMCQDKLNIKDIQAELVRDDSSSSASENSCSHPALSVTSLSEPDLNGSPSLSTTTDELSNLERRTPGDGRAMTYAKELINNMWNDFSVEDYIQYDSDLQTAKKKRKKPKSWTPKITVPVPFEMTVREQNRREKAPNARADLETRQKLLKENEDEAECKKKFRANPVPSGVLLPLYEDLVKQSEERRKKVREKSKAALLASQKPFKFIAREEQKQAVREKKLRDLFRAKRKTKQFKARPVPHFIYRPAANDKPKEELYGDSRMQPKARDLQNSPWPSQSTYRRFRDPRSSAKLRGKHRRRYLSPSAGDLEKWRESDSEHSFLKCPVLCEQCCLLESQCDNDKRQKLLVDIRADEENLRETCRPNLSPRRKSPRRSAYMKPRPRECSPPLPTASSRGREQAIRKSLEEKKMLEEERNRILIKQKQRMKDLQKLLATRVKAYGSHQSLSQIVKSRVTDLRRNEKARMKEYWQELEEQDAKLQKRPMLFERVAQRNARMAAERRYSNTLKALGLSEEFVSEKGQSGKVSENITRQELRSCTSDKESSYGEERENEEENYLTDTSSQDSCKGNKDDIKGSGEENSGE
ncbi:protein FAM161A isoform X1 [Arvicanthis niloticus]|uniref:protein FAM161A isoform X1 n=1 Tax=Arvicanthis niloticus TaxID=61156 RepID=UPI0014862AD2|nr:protein FAM161A isoform X1 [Arvicanthis niloticus]XP_034364259.1 protein FAM161A isoform X1 [Arvicanthis niloticus]XP_034364260.1 protein FAM161A isoform X1 [Arvicanthis niloticus]XP_034364261.1 protein FAM161A isoform X1 [Arvicanthis niloticus]